MWLDFRHAIRQWARRPGLAVTSIVVLALAIGSATAVFALVDATLFRELAVGEPDRLVRLFPEDERNEMIGNSSVPAYRAYRDGISSFADVAVDSGWNPAHVALPGREPARVGAGIVSGNFFAVLGVDALHGRTLKASDDETEGAHPVVVLSHAYWQERFGADPRAIGATLLVNQVPFEVVGVMPRGFAGVATSMPSIYLPLSMWKSAIPQFADADALDSDGFTWLEVVARLAPGVTLEAAQAEAELFARQRHAAVPDGAAPPRVRLVPAGQAAIDPYGTSSAQRLAWLLTASVLAVLLIACLDVACLLLVRREERTQELAVRLGVGARPARLLRQLVVEGSVLAIAGGALGAWLGVLALDASIATAPRSFDLPLGLVEREGSWRIAAVAFGLTAVAALAASVLPALGASRVAPAGAIRGQGGGVLGRSTRAGHVLVATQIGFSLALVCMAAVLLRSVAALSAVDPGFDPRGLAVASVDLTLQGYDEGRGRAFREAVLARLREQPGVVTAALARTAPLASSATRASFLPPGHTADMPAVNATLNVVSPGYFDTVGQRIVAGRAIDARDTASAPPVAVVTESLADQYWNGAAVGQRVDVGRTKGVEIVGVVADSAFHTLRDRHADVIHLAQAQSNEFSVGLLARVDPAVVSDPIEPIRAAVRALDPALPVHAAHTLDERLASSIANETLVTRALTFFGAMALVLSVAGMYGLFAYGVRRRRRELGLRLALGADANAIVALVMRQGVRLLGAGLVIGLVGGLLGVRSLDALVFGVARADPWTFVAAAAIVAAAALAALYAPARNAARTDPKTSLRSD